MHRPVVSILAVVLSGLAAQSTTLSIGLTPFASPGTWLPVDTLAISPTVLHYSLYAVQRDTFGNFAGRCDSVVWWSSDSSFVTVQPSTDSLEQATATVASVRADTATIYALCPSTSDTASICFLRPTAATVCDVWLSMQDPDTVVSGECIGLTAPPFAIRCGNDTVYPSPDSIAWRIADGPATLSDSVGTSLTFCALGTAGVRTVSVTAQLDGQTLQDLLLVVVLERSGSVRLAQAPFFTPAHATVLHLFDLTGRRLAAHNVSARGSVALAPSTSGAALLIPPCTGADR